MLTIEIDNRDKHLLDLYKWSINSKGYVTYAEYVGGGRQGKKKRHYLARIILSATSDQVVDHIDGNPLNNRRSNLRLCTRKENSWNRGINRNSTTGLRGITWEKRRKRWKVLVGYNYKRIFVGEFSDLRTAQKAYSDKAKQLYGEYSRF